MAFSAINTKALVKETCVVTMMNDYPTFINATALININHAGGLYEDMYNDSESTDGLSTDKKGLIQLAKDAFCVVDPIHMNPAQKAIHTDVLARLDEIAKDDNIIVLVATSQHMRGKNVYTTFSFEIQVNE